MKPDMLKSLKISATLFFILITISYAVNVFIYHKDSSPPHFSTLSFLMIIIIAINSSMAPFVVIGVILLFLLMIELFYTLVFGERISENVLSSIVESNLKEAFLMSFHYLFFLFLPAMLVTCSVFFFLR